MPQPGGGGADLLGLHDSHTFARTLGTRYVASTIYMRAPPKDGEGYI